MKICVENLPAEARIYVKEKDVIRFNDLVVHFDEDVEFNSGAIVRARLFGMTPYEYVGSKEHKANLVVDGVLTPMGYRDMSIPNELPELPIDECAMKIRQEAIKIQEEKYNGCIH